MNRVDRAKKSHALMKHKVNGKLATDKHLNNVNSKIIKSMVNQ